MSNTHQSAAPSTIPPAQRHLRILSVDDEDVNHMVITAALEPLGHTVACAASAAEAHATASAATPDLVLLDVMMPGESGVELCRRWRGDPRMDHTPIVLVTALGASSHRTAGLAAGADDFIEKPVDVDELARRVVMWLALGREPQRNLAEQAKTSETGSILAAAAQLMGDGPVDQLAAAMARAVAAHGANAASRDGDRERLDVERGHR